MNPIDRLTLVLTLGLRAEDAYRLANQDGRFAPIERDELARLVHQVLVENPTSAPHPRVEIPARPKVDQVAATLQRLGISLHLRGEASYPGRLLRNLGQQAPWWIWRAGPPHRLDALACAFVGSRQSPARFLAATRKLATALADRELVIVSGLAPGADQAAHEGAIQGKAGTLALPARGLLNLDLSPTQGPQAPMTCLGLDRPYTRFSPGLAIRRNTLIAAMSHGLVLVATGLKGGSWHAVRWAMARGWPLWCLEDGKSTPAGNAALLRQNLARPLPVRADPRELAQQVALELEKHRSRIETQPPSPDSQVQLDWLSLP